ncbi:MAG: right-handed parallel beta-helix repeat-containing protein [Candidatus Eiseniibacteriota bacterium]
MRTAPLAFALLTVPFAASAVTWVVPDSVPTVGGALALAGSGDSVVVGPGTYPEVVDMVDGVVLLAADPENRPVLDGGGAGTPLTAQFCSTGTVVSGFVFANGVSVALGGGVYLNRSVMQILDCRFANNSAAHGGGLGADASAFVLAGCEFEGNSAAQTGGAVSVTGLGSPSLTGCTFRGNSALVGGAVAVRNGSTPIISASLLDGNQADQGGGLWYDFFTGGSLSGCTLAFNDATSGLGAGAFLNSLATPALSTCIFAFGVGGAGLHTVAGAAPTYSCNDLFGNAGGDALGAGVDLGGNVFADPLFCGAQTGVFTLQDTSPCLAANSGGCGQIGAFDAGGCGAVGAGSEMAVASWGAVKSRYRGR